MFRAILLSVLAFGAASAAHADHGRRDWRADQREWRQDRRAWRGDPWQGRRHDRVVVLPPRAYRHRAPPPPPGWYPGWREPWRHGYRFRSGDRHRFVAPGRPAVELSLVFPLY